MKPHKVSAEHAVELKAIAARLSEIAAETGMSIITLTAYDWDVEPAHVNIHAHHDVTADGATVRPSGNAVYKNWYRDGFKYCSMVKATR